MASSPPIDARPHLDAAERERVATLVDHSLTVIAGNQAASGAYPASPTFPVYRYCWFRDGAFIADAMSRAGRVESYAIPSEAIKKIRILPVDWTQETGELTPKMSLKRAAIARSRRSSASPPSIVQASVVSCANSKLKTQHSKLIT